MAPVAPAHRRHAAARAIARKDSDASAGDVGKYAKEAATAPKDKPAYRAVVLFNVAPIQTAPKVSDARHFEFASKSNDSQNFRHILPAPERLCLAFSCDAPSATGALRSQQESMWAFLGCSLLIS